MQLPGTGIRFILEGTKPATSVLNGAAPEAVTQVTMDLVGEGFWNAMGEGLGWAARMGVKMFRNVFPLKVRIIVPSFQGMISHYSAACNC
jgi:hypothetical protein